MSRKKKVRTTYGFIVEYILIEIYSMNINRNIIDNFTPEILNPKFTEEDNPGFHGNILTIMGVLIEDLMHVKKKRRH